MVMLIGVMVAAEAERASVEADAEDDKPCPGLGNIASVISSGNARAAARLSSAPTSAPMREGMAS